MNNPLENIIKWLHKSPKHGLEIVNIATEAMVNKNLTAQDLETYPDWKDYFLELSQKGITKIQVQRTKKQGNSNIRQDNVPKKFELGTTAESVVESVGNPSNGAGTLPHQAQNIPAMAAPQATPGLTGVEAFKVYNHDQLQNKVSELERKNETLETENKKLDRDNMRHVLGLEGKPGAIEKLMENLTPETIAMVAQAIASAKSGGGGNMPALNAPDLGRYKTELINLISSESYSEAHAHHLVLILNRSNDQEFIQQLNSLINGTGND